MSSSELTLYPHSAYDSSAQLMQKIMAEKESNSNLITSFYMGKKASDGVIYFTYSPFDSDVLGWKCIRCEPILPKRKSLAWVPQLKHLIDNFKKQHYRFIFARLPASHIEAIQGFQQLGFFLTEVLHTFKRKPRAFPRQSVSLCTSSDIQPLTSTSQFMYPTHRFGHDPFILPKTAQKVYDEWMKQNIQGRSANVWVARSSKKPCGYLAENILKIGEVSIAVIDLVAVNPHKRGKGIATHLVKQAIRWAHKRCDYIQVGTTSENKAAIGLYTKLGFTLAYTQVSLHAHLL